MKTKIIFLMLVFISIAINANAQCKIFSGNAVSIGTLSAPPSGYELQVTGNSIFNNNVNISGVLNGKNYSIPSPGVSQGWVKVGTFTAAQSGQTIKIVAYIHNGYNATNSQDATYNINFKTSNGSSVDANGFAGNGSWYSIGFDNTIQPGYIKWKANAAGVNATSFDLYIYVPAFADNSHYSVSINNGASWTNVGLSGQSDPGAASSTVLIPITQFNLPYGNVGIGTSTPGYNLDVNGGFRASGAGIFANSYVIGNTRTYGMYWANSFLGYFSFPASYVATLMNASLGIGTLPGNFTLNVNGNTACNGNVWTSDQQFKTNTDSLHYALATIRQLKPKSYYFDTTNVYGFKFQSKKQYGFIAQDVEHVLPNLVTTSTKPAEIDSVGHVVHPSITYKSLNYIGFISILTKGIQELSKSNDSLKNVQKATDSLLTVLQKQLIANTSSLQQQINACCTKGSIDKTTRDNNTYPSTDLDLLSKSAILYQNMPNPFGDGTVIKYFVPDNVTSANIIFYDEFGNEIKDVELPNKGITAVLNLSTLNLASGVYSYSLLINGKVIDTKKMIKT